MTTPSPRTVNEIRQAATIAALSILRMWADVREEAEKNEPDPGRRQWYRSDLRLGYSDSLFAMEKSGLIDTYDIRTPKVKVNGTWYIAVWNEKKRRFLPIEESKGPTPP